jgi:hypothetical protein
LVPFLLRGPSRPCSCDRHLSPRPRKHNNSSKNFNSAIGYKCWFK